MAPLLLVFAAVLSLDVVSKIAVRAFLPFGAEIPLLPVFSLVHVNNTGIAFGLFQRRNFFFLVLGTAVLMWLVGTAWHLRRRDRFTSLVLSGVSAGALGNLIDRLLYGQVTDFLDFYIGAHHWPAFNVADSAICVGVGLLLWRGLRQAEPK